MSAHPVLRLWLEAAHGRFPPVDGRAEIVPALPDGSSAVVSFTGHAVVATGLSYGDLADLPLDGFGSALHPDVLLRLAGPGGRVEEVDVTLAGRGLGGGRLPLRDDLDDHPRVRLARRRRTDVRVHGDRRGLVTVAHGLAGRTEVSVEAADPGAGAGLVAEALALVPRGEPVFAAVSPGNARSLRAFLGAGFVPLGSEVLILPA